MEEIQEGYTLRYTTIPAIIPIQEEILSRTAIFIICKSTVRKSVRLFVIIVRDGKSSERNIPKTEPRTPPAIIKRKKKPIFPRSNRTIMAESNRLGDMSIKKSTAFQAVLS